MQGEILEAKRPGKVKGRRFELLLETIQVTAGVITREIASLRELSEWLG